MHLIVMTEAAQGGGAPEAALDSPSWEGLLQRWSPLMMRLAPSWALQEDPEALNTLAEQAWARLVWGRALQTPDDGRLPLEAWLVGDTSGTAWARLSPFHGLVGADRITLLPPADLQLSESESRELFAAVHPLFDSEGVQLQWHGPTHWRVAHESLRDLPCASRPRAEGDSVQRWQGRTPLAASRLLRRLQNEAQMVLHEHPVNRLREERGALAVNSLWLDHAGAATGPSDPQDGAAAQGPTTWLQAVRATAVRPWSQAHEALQAWVDRALVPPAEGQSEPVLVLCGRYAAQAFTMRRLPGGWRGAIARTLKPPPRSKPLRDWLQGLDAPPSGAAP